MSAIPAQMRRVVVNPGAIEVSVDDVPKPDPGEVMGRRWLLASAARTRTRPMACTRSFRNRTGPGMRSSGSSELWVLR